eukprot:CAMPEP_0113316298 /NCGR_PEP_ID=MMETSP0010_2-20120614/11626_1 /TAXON_ID=216773 ORGANISM="Corethron hystrix, Strain 308" /NCGR_SAMPLE_ID=MMETSP0010_2 /ASSEMBLY_ACC=CAM_ASM_000155 /LENGTH=386 /DNA_ID=CAMNT_0000172979 /DNA_START=308 /DNA_END=1468 /DNA_ORIENTATION=- /assembly_acc=CAM_ASM_000155
MANGASSGILHGDRFIQVENDGDGSNVLGGMREKLNSVVSNSLVKEPHFKDNTEAGGAKGRSGATNTSIFSPRSTNEVDDLYFIYVNDLVRVPTNSQPFPINDDFFEGFFLPMFRTASMPPEDDVDGRRTQEHFQGKKRMFEFQFQGRLKQRPEGHLWLSIEIDNPVKIGMIQRAFLKVALNFISRRNKGFHYSFGDLHDKTEEDIKEGNYEKLHLSFALDHALSRLVISGEEDDLPRLGTNIPETRESVKRRKRGESGAFPGWNTRNTYTMSIWSEYIDFFLWKIVNIPGIRPFGISKIIGKQNINVMYYSVEGCSDVDGNQPHLRKDMKVFAHYEIGHLKHTEGGNTQKYINKISKTEIEDCGTIGNVMNENICFSHDLEENTS